MPRPKGATAAAKAAKIRIPRDPSYYAEIGRKGGTALRERYGAEYFAQIGKKGGKATKNNNPSDYYAIIGAKGGATKHAGKSKP